MSLKWPVYFMIDQYTVYVSGSDYVTTNYSGNAVRFANLRSFQSSALLPSLIVRDDKSRQGSMLDIVVS